MADQFSESDVDSLGEKLEAFSQTLAPGEHAALIEVLQRAIPPEGDVQGYAFKARATAQSVTSVKMLVKHIFRLGGNWGGWQ